MRNFSKDEVIKLIDIRFHTKLVNTEYIASEINARKIDLSKRVDILLKIELIKAYSKNNSELFEYYKLLYLETIRLFTDNTFVEPGDSSKRSPEDYIRAFIDLYEEVKSKGFNFSLGLIPFSGNTPLDGAHRTAIAYFFDCKLSIVDIGSESVDYGIGYFYSRGASDKLIATLSLLLNEYDEDVRAAIVWPSAGFDIKSIIKLFGSTYLFSKKLYLDKNGVNNLCVNAYKNESWVGNDADHWRGAWAKSTACYDKNATIVIIFKPGYPSQDLEIKNKIRSLRDGTKHCIHSTDKSEDTADIINCTFPIGSESYLNAINIKEFSKLRSYIKQQNIADHIITGSSFMGVLGIRNSNDVDTISLDGTGAHNAYSQFFSKKIQNLFLINDCQYRFLDISFLNLEEIAHFKNKRNEKKDIDDIKLINAFSSNKLNCFTGFMLITKKNVSQNVTWFKRFLVKKGIAILKMFYLYDMARWAYRKYFN